MITTLYRLLELLNGIVRRRLASHLPGSSRRTAGTRPSGVRGRANPRRRVNHLRAIAGDAGMTTAEYAVGTVAAVAFAVVLFKVVQSPAVHSALTAIVTGALHVRM